MDDQDRVLILHGINLSGRSKRPPFLPEVDRAGIARLRKAGFNSVRYLIVWEAVEPEPGKYDDAYLDKVAERLEWCREAGLRVVLDMHQDMYSRKYTGDGAPVWACIDDDVPFTKAPGTWYLGYASPAVIKAFDNFWANRKGPGGVGIQDRFVAAWQHVAKRFRSDTNIIGYDLLNEPYYGSDIYAMFFALAIELGQEFDTKTKLKFLGFMTNPKGAVEFGAYAVKELKRRNALWRILDETSGPAQKFERTVLQPFHDRLVRAIREVDPNHICFFEAAGGPVSGTRFRTAINVPKDAHGKPFEHTVFAPHHYDFSTDLHFPYDGTRESVLGEIRRGASAGDRMGAPTWFGEWGAIFRSSPEGDRLVRDHLDAFDDLLCGWAWWSYSERLKDLSFLPMLGRPYARAVAGVPKRTACTEKDFHLEFEPLSKGGETLIWVPPSLGAAVDIRVEPETKSAMWWRDESGMIHVRCPDGVRACSVTVMLTAKPQ
ncbi:MAG: glycoside hydrolase family 5 protein [Planctomycetes bacterium]|nr:glycoside hydrolase family 5 protein [Planctomycetota bacterium]